MKKLSRKASSILAVIIFTAATIFSGCSSPNQKVEAAQDNVNQAKDNVTQAKENLTQAEADYKMEIANFKEESNRKSIANEQAIAEYKIQMAAARKEDRESYQKQIAVLEQRNSDLKRRMDEYNDDGNEKWQSFKREFNHDMEELGKSLKDFSVNNKK